MALVELIEKVPMKRYTCKPCPNPDAALVGFCSICDLAPLAEGEWFPQTLKADRHTPLGTINKPRTIDC